MESKGKSYLFGKTSWYDEARHLVRELERAGFEVIWLSNTSFSYLIEENNRKVGIISGDVVATCGSMDLEDFLDNYHFE